MFTYKSHEQRAAQSRHTRSKTRENNANDDEAGLVDHHEEKGAKNKEKDAGAGKNAVSLESRSRSSPKKSVGCQRQDGEQCEESDGGVQREEQRSSGKGPVELDGHEAHEDAVLRRDGWHGEDGAWEEVYGGTTEESLDRGFSRCHWCFRDVIVVVVGAIVAVVVVVDNGSVFSDSSGRVTAVECFWHERHKYDAADGNEAKRDAERAPYGDVCERPGDDGAEEIGGENSGDDPLEACCSGLVQKKRG